VGDKFAAAEVLESSELSTQNLIKNRVFQLFRYPTPHKSGTVKQPA
jgi:hypothetical protein